MSDWIKHDGGPQPVAGDVEVEVLYRRMESPCKQVGPARFRNWKHRPEKANNDIISYRILNQHLIDAARREGIRLGLEAAAWWLTEIANAADQPESKTLLAGASRLRDLNADSLAREAVLDQLTSEAQAQDMGYDKENTR